MSAGAAKKSEKRPEDRLTIKLLRLADILFARVYHNTTILTPCPIPKEGPGILVCNHIGAIDPACIQAACSSRCIQWMMAKEYLEIKPMRWFFDAMEIIPVDRGGRDSSSLRTALRSLENGRVLGIFPEGKFSLTKEMLPFQTGLAQIAIKTGAPIYPAYIDGNYRNMGMIQGCLQRNNITLAFGPAVQFDRSGSPREQIATATQEIRNAVEALRKLTDARRPQYR